MPSFSSLNFYINLSIRLGKLLCAMSISAFDYDNAKLFSMTMMTSIEFLTNCNQAFKILRADSCTSDVETRINFKKMDKYS